MYQIYQPDTIRVILNIYDNDNDILALPSFIMGVNSTLFFEAQKSAFIHHKSHSYGSRGLK